MIIKTTEGHGYVDDLEDIVQSVSKYDMLLNPATCYFRVQAVKFLGFTLTRRGIEANLNKFQTIIDIRSPTDVKEVQQFTRRLATLSCFLLCAGDKTFLFFAALRKKVKFEWKPECEESFIEIKKFLSSPSILTRPKENLHFLRYLSSIENDMSLVLIQEIEKAEKHVYFISKMFKGAKKRYQKIEKLVLAVVTAIRKIRSYFQGHTILVKTNYRICQVLKKPDLAGRMVSWSADLSK